MKFLVKVKVNTTKLKEFGETLQRNGLDRSCIRGETFCLAEDPAIGYSVWEAENKNEFDTKFKNWKEFYSETDVKEIITPNEAMMKLFSSQQ
jgi:hypothetical protein